MMAPHEQDRPTWPPPPQRGIFFRMEFGVAFSPTSRREVSLQYASKNHPALGQHLQPQSLMPGNRGLTQQERAQRLRSRSAIQLGSASRPSPLTLTYPTTVATVTGRNEFREYYAPFYGHLERYPVQRPTKSRTPVRAPKEYPHPERPPIASGPLIAPQNQEPQTSEQTTAVVPLSPPRPDTTLITATTRERALSQISPKTVRRPNAHRPQPLIFSPISPRSPDPPESVVSPISDRSFFGRRHSSLPGSVSSIAEGHRPNRRPTILDDKPLPEIPSRYRLGEEELPWSPSPCLMPLDFDAARPEQSLYMESLDETHEQNVRAESSFETMRLEDPQRSRELEQFNHAMVGVDVMGNGWWSPGGRTDSQMLNRLPQGVGWAIRVEPENDETCREEGALESTLRSSQGHESQDWESQQQWEIEQRRVYMRRRSSTGNQWLTSP